MKTISLGIILSLQLLTVPSFAGAIPSSIALDAAKEALNTCQKQGYHVTVAIVNRDGLLEVLLRGDDATPHTIETAKAKAFTAVTLGPIRNENLTSEIAAAAVSNPLSAQLAHLPGVILLGGGALIRSTKGNVVGAIGVSGAPGGHFDEACALAGIAKIKDHI